MAHTNTDQITTKIAKGYEGLGSSFDKIVQSVVALRDQANAEARAFNQLAEDRKREEDVYQYETATAREREKKVQADEDLERTKQHNQRLSELALEKAEIDKTVAQRVEETRAVIVKAEVAKEVAIATSALKREYEQDKKLLMATEGTRFRELELKNEILTKQADELKRQNDKLLEQQATLAKDMKDVATVGLGAAGNLKQATDLAMQTAVSSGVNRSMGRG